MKEFVYPISPAPIIYSAGIVHAHDHHYSRESADLDIDIPSGDVLVAQLPTQPSPAVACSHFAPGGVHDRAEPCIIHRSANLLVALPQEGRGPH